MRLLKSRLATFLFILLLCAFLAGSGSNAAADRIHIVVLGTTDLHGNIYPIDYYKNAPDNRGLAKIATLITRVRKESPNVLLIDSGDTIQGTPLEYYHNKKNK